MTTQDQNDRQPITSRELLLAHAKVESDAADRDLAEVMRDIAICNSNASTHDRAIHARMAASNLVHAVRRLSRAEAFEQAAKLIERGES